LWDFWLESDTGCVGSEAMDGCRLDRLAEKVKGANESSGERRRGGGDSGRSLRLEDNMVAGSVGPSLKFWAVFISSARLINLIDPSGNRPVLDSSISSYTLLPCR
jgi:hypothetical protein